MSPGPESGWDGPSTYDGPLVRIEQLEQLYARWEVKRRENVAALMAEGRREIFTQLALKALEEETKPKSEFLALVEREHTARTLERRAAAKAYVRRKLASAMRKQGLAEAAVFSATGPIAVRRKWRVVMAELSAAGINGEAIAQVVGCGKSSVS